MSSDLKSILPFEVSTTDYRGHKYFALGGTTRHENNAPDSFDDRETMMRSKYLALEPFNKNSSHQRPLNEMPKVHMRLNPSAKSPQKRKLDQYMNDGKSVSTFQLIRGEKYGTQNAKNQRSQSCSLLDSPFSAEKWINLQETQGQVAYPTLSDTTKYCSICRQDYSHLSDLDDTIKESKPGKQGNLESQCKDLMSSRSYTPTIETSIKEKSNMEFSKDLKSLDFVDSSETSNSLSLKSEDMKLDQPLKNFLPSRGNHLPRPVIPIGPRFQAKVPKLEGTTNIKHHNSDDDLKWLGTQIWPMPVITKANTKGIGKCRLNSCFYDFQNQLIMFNNTLLK